MLKKESVINKRKEKIIQTFPIDNYGNKNRLIRYYVTFLSIVIIYITFNALFCQSYHGKRSSLASGSHTCGDLIMSITVFQGFFLVLINICPGYFFIEMKNLFCQKRKIKKIIFCVFVDFETEIRRGLREH